VEEGYIAIVPTGCTEQQGSHTNVDFDTWLATELSIESAIEATERYGVKALVTPQPFHWFQRQNIKLWVWLYRYSTTPI
jgi:creatinine amidohydrolase/Fe(II)-dependent formamide hydrolase-like protein